MMKIGRFLQLTLLILLAAGSQPALSAFWEWSKTASSNATADPSINWSEGMSPSSVNDSARAMMARAAEYRDDISGALTLAGTATAYTLTTNQGLDATPVTGQMLAFLPNVTNGVAATLTVDGGTTYPLQSVAGTALPAGSIIAGTPYRASFNGTAWVMEGGYGNPYATALGAFMLSTSTAVPNSNFIVPAGQCISTTTYSTYWVLVGSPASGSCPGGQFAVIDMRGRVPAAVDSLNATTGLYAQRLTAYSQGCGTTMETVGAACANGLQTRPLTVGQIPTITSSGTITVSSTQGAIPSNTTQVGTVDASGTGDRYGILGPASGTAPATIGTITSVGSSQTMTTVGTSGGDIPMVQPTIAVSYFLRVI